MQESHTTTTNNDLGGPTSYAEAVVEGSKLGQPLDGGIESHSRSQLLVNDGVASHDGSRSYPGVISE